MMAIHHTFQLFTTTLCDETSHVFTNIHNALYLLNTQIKHPTLHNNRSNKNILKSMIKILQSPLLRINKKCLVKFQSKLYMGHAQKQLLFGKEDYPSKTCPNCNSLDADTWLYVLFKCKQQHIHALITKMHNKIVWEIC